MEYPYQPPELLSSSKSIGSDSSLMFSDCKSLSNDSLSVASVIWTKIRNNRLALWSKTKFRTVSASGTFASLNAEFTFSRVTRDSNLSWGRNRSPRLFVGTYADRTLLARSLIWGKAILAGTVSDNILWPQWSYTSKDASFRWLGA